MLDQIIRRTHSAIVSLLRQTSLLLALPALTLVIGLLPERALAQQATLTDDAQTSAKEANRNFGSNESLQVTTTDKSFIKFKLTPNLPAGTIGGHIGKATLKVFVSDVANAGQITIYRVTGAWTEQSITDASAPPLGAVVTTLNIDASNIGKWVTIDVTQLVKHWD